MALCATLPEALVLALLQPEGVTVLLRLGLPVGLTLPTAVAVAVPAAPLGVPLLQGEGELLPLGSVGVALRALLPVLPADSVAQAVGLTLLLLQGVAAPLPEAQKLEL